MKLATKIQKGSSIELKSKDASDGPFHATLLWKTAVDLDLHCFYKLKSSEIPPPPSGFFAKLFSSTPASEGQVYFASKGSNSAAPWISLDQDSGVGDVGGDNEENMHFWDIDKLEFAIIVANIFGKNTNFSQYSGRVIVEGGGNKFEVPLSETKKGSWCIVASIDNRSGVPRLANVNKVQSNKPNLNSFM